MGAKRKKRVVRRKARRRAAKRRPAKRRKKAARRRTKRRAAKRTTRRRTTRRRTTRRKKRKPNPSFMKPVRPDVALSAVVGAKPLPRTQLTKKLWQYIKRHRLQDRKNRRMINADARLRPVFNGRSKVSMFEMTKLVSRHVK